MRDDSPSPGGPLRSGPRDAVTGANLSLSGNRLVMFHRLRQVHYFYGAFLANTESQSEVSHCAPRTRCRTSGPAGVRPRTTCTPAWPGSSRHTLRRSAGRVFEPLHTRRTPPHQAQFWECSPRSYRRRTWPFQGVVRWLPRTRSQRSPPRCAASIGCIGLWWCSSRDHSRPTDHSADIGRSAT